MRTSLRLPSHPRRVLSPSPALRALLVLVSLCCLYCSEESSPVSELSDSSTPDNAGGSAGMGSFGPTLPECLQGDDPGCATAPNLPSCLTDGTEAGCAQPPQLPDWSCPAGWGVETVGEGESWQHTICSLGALPTCAAGEAIYPGEAACHAVGTSCPGTGFLSETQLRGLAAGYAGKIWYVQLGSTGDGSLQSPFGTVADAHAAAAPGDILALGPQTFSEPISITKALALLGSCVTKTVVQVSTPADKEAAIDIVASDVLIGNLRVGGARRGIRVYTTGDVTLTDLEVVGATGSGIKIEKVNEALVQRVVIRDTEPFADTLQGGSGLGVLQGHATVRQVNLRANHRASVLVQEGGALTLDDAIVLDTQAEAVDPFIGFGVLVEFGTAQVNRAVVERSSAGGIVAAGAGASLQLTDVLVRDVLPNVVTGANGWGVNIDYAASGSLERVVVDRGHDVGLRASEQDTTLEATAVVVRDTACDQLGQQGSGVLVLGRAQGNLQRLVVLNSGVEAIGTADEGTLLEVTDAVLARGRGDDHGQRGAGLQVSKAAKATLTRGIVQGNRGLGVYLDSPGSEATLLDVLVRDTRAAGDGFSLGQGIALIEGAKASLERVTAFRNEEGGIGVKYSQLTGKQIRIAETLPTGASAEFGWGILINLGSQANLQQLVVDKVHTVGVAVEGIPGEAPSTVEFTDARISSVLGRETDQLLGIGLQIVTAQATATRVLVESAPWVGVLAEGAETSLKGSDVIVRLASPPDKGSFGDGITLIDGVNASLERVTVSQVNTAGVVVDGEDTTAQFRDLVVRDISSQRSDLKGGLGLSVQYGAKATVQRGVFLHTRSAAISSYSTDSQLVLREIVVRDIAAAECEEPTAPAQLSCALGSSVRSGGRGVCAVGGSVELEGFEISASSLCALQVAPHSKGRGNATMKAQRGRVHDNIIGLNVQQPDYDLATILGPTVRFDGNQNNVESASLAVPSAVDLVPIQ